MASEPLTIRAAVLAEDRDTIVEVTVLIGRLRHRQVLTPSQARALRDDLEKACEGEDPDGPGPCYVGLDDGSVALSVAGVRVSLSPEIAEVLADRLHEASCRAAVCSGVRFP